MDVKYIMSFYDVLGANCTLTLSVASYTGNPIVLTGGKTPVTVKYDGSTTDVFDPIRVGKATISIYRDANCNTLISDMVEIDDMTILASISTNAGFSYVGWVVPDTTKRNLSDFGEEIQLSTVDIFSIIKGLTAQKPDGTIIYGQQVLFSYMDILLKQGAHNAFGWGYNIVNDYSIDASLSSTNIFKLCSVSAEGFNDSNGRPISGYDIISKTMASFFSYIFLANGNINIISPASLNINNYKEILIKKPGVASNFLLGNHESITVSRGAKEVSVQFKYNTNNGMLQNAFFSQWNNGMPSGGWGFYSNGVLTPYTQLANLSVMQIGNSRIESNGGMRLQYIFDQYTSIETSFSVIMNKSPEVLKGQQFSLTYNVTYADYSKWTNYKTVKFPPAIYYMIELIGDSGNIYTLNGNKNWTNWETSNYKVLTATSGRQSISVNIPSLPENGYFVIGASTVAIDPSAYNVHQGINEDRTAITYNSIILNTTQPVGTQGINGNIDYLTQYKNFSLKDKTADSYMGTGIDGWISGSLKSVYGYTAEDGTIVTTGDVVKSVIKNGDTQSYTLLNQQVRAQMALKRSAKMNIDCEIYSNNIFFGDLLRFDDPALGGTYMQLTNEYDLKNATQKIVAADITPEFLPQSDSDYSDATIDSHETYLITQ